MSDDIVTRLRDEPPTLYFGNHQHWCEALGLMDEAADEIERLREAMRLMYAHYHAGNGAEVVAVYEKTMRNEP